MPNTEIAIQVAQQLVKTLRGSPRLIIWTWDTIKRYGEAKSLKTSYVFLFAVPMVARALTNAPDDVTLWLANRRFDIPLDLPFSWSLLFVCACLASLGNLIYAIACPELIKAYPDFPAFEAAKRDGTHLRPTVASIALTARTAATSDQIASIQQLYNDSPIDEQRLDSALRGGTSLLPSEFYFVRDSANLARPLPRLLASVAYFGAFICLAVIVGQNIAFVVAYYWARIEATG